MIIKLLRVVCLLAACGFMMGSMWNPFMILYVIGFMGAEFVLKQYDKR